MNELDRLIELNAGNLSATARELGVCYMSAWKWARGKAEPSKSMMNLIVKTLEAKEVQGAKSETV